MTISIKNDEKTNKILYTEQKTEHNKSYKNHAFIFYQFLFTNKKIPELVLLNKICRKITEY